jgi:hypothetical protein
MYVVASIRLRYLFDAVEIRAVWAVVTTVRTPVLLHNFRVSLMFDDTKDVVIGFRVNRELLFSVEMEQFLCVDDGFSKFFWRTIG